MRQYLKANEIDSTTIKQVTTVTNYKVKNIASALAVFGIEATINIGAASVLYGGSAIMFGSAMKQKNVGTKLILGASGAALTLLTSYACTEAIDNALEEVRKRVKEINDHAEMYATEDGYIYFYDWNSKQCHDPEKPILMKTRVECITKAAKLLGIAISNMDKRIADVELKKLHKLTNEREIAGAAWAIFKEDCESERHISEPGWMESRRGIRAEIRAFCEMYGADPAVWLQAHDAEFQRISEEATVICKLLHKDDDRTATETEILGAKWNAFKEAHGKDASDWASDAKLPVRKERGKTCYFIYRHARADEIRVEAETIRENEQIDWTAEEQAKNQARREQFIEVFGKTPEEYLGIEETRTNDQNKAAPKQETDQDEAAPKQEADDLNETDE